MNQRIEKKYRYPGVTPFSKEQANIFFGRQQDINELYRLIKREPLVVLYSKSGLGKSSLINAGIVPICQKEKLFFPVTIRFGAWTESTTLSPLEVIKNILYSSKKETALSKLIASDKSLWRYAKEKQLEINGPLLLIFDQFEELFTYPENQISEFQQEVSELLNTGIPLRFRRVLDRIGEVITDEEEDAIELPLDARILFAIRSDRIHLLGRLTNYLPNLLRNCFELRALKREDAQSAITLPAEVNGEFVTQAFRYSDRTITSLLEFLEDGQERRVEGILLQMLCEHYERKYVEERCEKELDINEIDDPIDVVKHYYEEKLQSFDERTERKAVRLLIEEGLVSEGETMRLSLHEANILQEYKIEKKTLEKLVSCRLLRSEPFLRGGYTYELSHDRLIFPVIDSRTRRRNEEQTIERKRLHELAEKERNEKVEAQKRLRNVRILLLISLFALSLAGYSVYDSLKQKEIAKSNAKRAINNEKKAQEALLKFRKAERLRMETEVNSLLTKADNYLNLNQKELAIKALQEALNIDSTNINIHRKLNKIYKNE